MTRRRAAAACLNGSSRLASALAIAVVFLALSGTARGEQAMQRVVVHASPDDAWAAIGGFCGIADWHPEVVSCEVQSEGMPRTRVVTLVDGARFIEREVNWNDRGRAYSYTIVEGPLPVTNATAMIKVLPTEEGSVSLLWTGSYRPVGSPEEAKMILSGFYAAGLESLKAKLEAH